MGIGFAFYGVQCNKQKTFAAVKGLADRQKLECGIDEDYTFVSFCRTGILNFNFQNNELACECQSNIAGPGFHKAALEFTEAFLKETKLDANIEDEAEYLQYRDFDRMRHEHFDSWLAGVIRQIENMLKNEEYQNLMLGWEAEQYTPKNITGTIVTHVGRFAFEKLVQGIQKDGIEAFARQFFIWYQEEKDAYFYRNSALSRLWEDCYYRPSNRSDEDASVNAYIRNYLESAARISPDITLPLKEYRMLCELDGLSPTPINNPELKTDYPIGYRRDLITEKLGNLEITLPGSFLRSTEENLVYYDNEENWHSIVLTAFRSRDTPDFSPSVFANTQSEPDDFTVGDGRARMAYAGQQDNGSHHIIAQILSGFQVTFVTIIFAGESEKDWAFSFLRSLKAIITET